MGVPQDPTASWPGSESRSLRRTVWEILKASGVDPAPLRRTGPTWPQFLSSQADAILACDFFTADLLDGTQAYVLAVIEHATRRIRILGITLHPTGEWTTQQARNLIMDLGDQAHQFKFMIRDRGSNFTAAFDAILAGAGIRTVLCNVRTPRMNAIAERWIGGCRRELLDHTLVWNQAHLRRILREYATHHNQHRPHRSLHGAAPLKPLPQPVDLDQYRVHPATPSPRPMCGGFSLKPGVREAWSVRVQSCSCEPLARTKGHRPYLSSVPYHRPQCGVYWEVFMRRDDLRWTPPTPSNPPRLSTQPASWMPPLRWNCSLTRA